MTITELYYYAKAQGYEHKPLRIEYEASDGWYSLYEDIHKNNIEFTPKRVKIVF